MHYESPQIHPTAIIESGAILGSNVTVGAYAIIENGAKIGNDCLIQSHAVIKKYAVVGDNAEVGHFAVIGEILSTVVLTVQFLRVLLLAVVRG